MPEVGSLYDIMAELSPETLIHVQAHKPGKQQVVVHLLHQQTLAACGKKIRNNKAHSDDHRVGFILTSVNL